MYSQKLGGSSNKSHSRGGLSSGFSSSRNSSSEHLSGRDDQKKGQHKKPPKSPEVIRLEALIKDLEEGIDSSPSTGGCFCMARKHALSPYCPICVHCGLVFCVLQSPAAPCPFCFSPILSPNERTTVITRLRAEREEVLRQEESKREQEEIERRRQQEIARGGGEFPTLLPKSRGGASTPQNHLSVPHAAPNPKVLSLTGGHVTVQSIRKSSPTPRAARPAPAAPPTAEELAEMERLRPVPAPSTEVDYVKAAPIRDRPWLGQRSGGGFTYIPVEKEPPPAEETPKKKSRKKPKKEKGNEV